MQATRIGTSGWIYKAWRGPFYPDKLAQKRWFEHYAGAFDTTEINATFYRLPTQATVANWREAAPAGFIFAWKASRYITHMKRLRDVDESLARVFAPMGALGPKLGPCLFQLPPQMSADLERLKTFLGRLPAERRHVFEFRHRSWYEPAVFDALRDHGVAFCVSDHHHAPAPWMATADFVYLRGHGPGGRYSGSYSDAELAEWARHARSWADEGRDIFAYFDNDIGCAAPGDALRLKAMLGSSCRTRGSDDPFDKA